jgi:CHAT domain
MSANMYRGQLERKRRQRIDAEKKAWEFRKKEADKRKAATRAREAAGRSSSGSTIRTKLGEADRREKEANDAAADAAQWQGKAAGYGREEGRLIESLAKADASERAAADRARQRQNATRQREHEKAEAELRELLDGAQKELADQRTRTEAMDNRVDEVLQQIRAPKPEPLRVLMLGASGDGELRVAREQARIRAAVERALHRDLVELDARPAATLEDLLDGLSRFRPHVVHFSGHSSELDIEFEKDVDEAHDLGDVTSAAAFAQALAAIDEPPVLVVLNSCHSAGQIEDLVATTVPFAIGMADQIDDGDAILYAARFYASLANGQSVLAAHDAGRAALALAGLIGMDLPTLAAAPGFDPRAAVLVRVPD